VISPIALKAFDTHKVMTGHMKGLLKLFDLNRPSYEVDSYMLRYEGRREKKPISSICPLKSNPNNIVLGCYSGNKAYLVDQRHLNRQV